MHAYGSASQSSRDKKTLQPSQELRVALTFRSANGGPGPTKYEVPVSLAAVHRFIPDALVMDQAIHAFARAGFRLTRRGRLTASLRCTRAQYEKVFGTKLSKVKLDPKQDYAFYSLYYPAQGAPWKPDPALAGLID